MCESCGCGEHDSHHHDHIKMGESLTAYNDRFAEKNREFFRDKKIIAFNLLSSPGSGKTSFLIKIIKELKKRFPVAVIEGDQQTDLDAAKIKKTGAKTVQINTGKACHLDAHMVGHAVHDLELADESVLFIENVGNLVCPADFDLGENLKVVFLSVAEGDEKPLKYPFIFAKADAVVISKTDLIPYVDFDMAKAKKYAKQANPYVQIFEVSVKTGEGIGEFRDWVMEKYEHVSCRTC